jgi:hypothetical protein
LVTLRLGVVRAYVMLPLTVATSAKMQNRSR